MPDTFVPAAPPLSFGDEPGALLFADLSMEGFKATCYRRTPLLVRGGAWFVLGKLYGLADFAAWRARMEQHCADNLRVDGERLIAVLRASCVDPELAAAAERHGRFFSDMSCAFDAFYTGQELGGSVGAHFDDNDNIILQQVGHKRWKLSPPRHVHPRTLHARTIEGAKIGHVVMPDEQLELVLGPGDALYIPSLWAHWGIGEGESLSLSLAMNPLDSGRVLREHPHFPAVESFMRGQPPHSVRGPVSDPARGIADLEAFAGAPPEVSYFNVGGVDLGQLLDIAARGSLARLLGHLSLLDDRPIAATIRKRLMEALAGLGQLGAERTRCLLHTNLFGFWSERALEAISFGDAHRLEELGETLSRWNAVLAASGVLEVSALLEETRGVPSLQELELVETTAHAWAAVAEHAPTLAELGRRSLPLIPSAAQDQADSRPDTSLALRIGRATTTGPSTAHDAVHALGMRAGRALAQALPALSGGLVERTLPALHHEELRCLADFCGTFGYLAQAVYAERREDRAQARALRERTREAARRLLGDARVTPAARGWLTRIGFGPE